ncbi:cysteine synthase CysM [Membranicola marinus]|uniref:cysteine synthase n=1 Tax=Membranihabitans marinus TaxID=1227546 RepID=A0A953LEN6_9BACT|nr:cysteine synthase CysM [Membranihabitans marinus]MBY5960179.1 cysteine synthase CysM [Membranihabitans marinus]
MQDILDLIGQTPLVQIHDDQIPAEVNLLAKLESANPGGSVKDRTALGMIRGAMERGALHEGDKIIEATSGNTGIALAMIARQFGLSMTLVMPENSTQERIDTMKAYGGRVILTPAEKTIEYSRKLAEEMAEEEGYYILNQFNNPDNYKIHYQTTGPEIWEATSGDVTHFVSSMGTTGTIMGVSRYLKEKNKAVKIIGAQPSEGSNIPGIRRWSPEYLPKIFEPDRVDYTREVSRRNAIEHMKTLARDHGIFAGMSSGGAFSIARDLALTLTNPATIVFIVCDLGDRYLSSGIYSE